ncbi:MAG: LuxR C-terminal-related transcriptional regulator [Acidobacteriota bacterium]
MKATLNPLDIVETTADPAFATDEDGRIVIWNRAAARFLGFPAEAVLGQPCHEVLGGLDASGNRYCDSDCNLCKMVRRREPIRSFDLFVKTASGTLVRAVFSILAVCGPRSSQFNLIHIFQPAVQRDGTDALLAQLAGAAGSQGAGAAREPAPAPPAGGRDGPATPQPALTAREIEVLKLLSEGSTPHDIADALFISVTTVRTHIQNMLRKLEVHSTLQAVSMALRNRLI